MSATSGHQRASFVPRIASPIAIDVAMAHQDVPIAREPASQLLDDRDRAMAPARAADADRDVQLAFLLELRQREPQQALDLLHELAAALGFGAEHELRDLGIAAIEVRQRRLEVRVRQESNVEHEVELERQTVLEAERHERHRELAGAAVAILDDRLQLMHVEVGRVDDRRAVAQLGHQLAIAAHAIDEIIARQRMPPPRLGESPEQHLVGRVEEHHLEPMTGAAEHRDRLVPRRQVLALASIDRDRELVAVTLVGEVIDHLRHERHRDVVDARELDVLERTQRRALPCSRQSGDDDDLHRSLHRVPLGLGELGLRLGELVREPIAER